MAALINWLLAEGQTSHLEELTGPALPGCVSANDNKDAPPAPGERRRSPASKTAAGATSCLEPSGTCDEFGALRWALACC